jgi:Fe-Mn family superoxide dismutase
MAYPFQLPELGFDHDALEPHIDERTMRIHHGKHHAGYTNKLNGALEGYPAYHEYSASQLLLGLHALPDAIRSAVRNNGGGYHNHSLFWEVIAPGGASAPSGDLAASIDGAFGSLEGFKDAFNAAAGARFGSGWGWLVVDPFGELKVYSTANQDSPLTRSDTPILGVDVWEHAYYLNYQNRRPDYLTAFWNVVSWDAVAAKFEEAKGGWIHSVR